MRRNSGLLRTAILMATLLLGAAAAGRGAEPPQVLFDEGHGQLFLVEREGPLQLSGLAAIFRHQGFRVRASAQRLSEAQLDKARVLIISGPFQPLASEEIAAVRAFLQRGGSLAVMLHIGPPVAGLLEVLGVEHANGVLRERANVLNDQPLDFWVRRLEPHPLFAGLERFGLFGGWALRSRGEARVIARTGPRAWIDLNGNQQLETSDAVQAFGVAVAGRLGAGRFVVFGDDAIFQNRYLQEYNPRLGRNLVAWLGKDPVPAAAAGKERAQ